MSAEMENYAFACATKALEKYHLKGSAAAIYIREKFDEKFNPAWHCIIGPKSGFSSSVYGTSSILFYFGKVPILLYRTDELIYLCRKCFQNKYVLF